MKDPNAYGHKIKFVVVFDKAHDHATRQRIAQALAKVKA